MDADKAYDHLKYCKLAADNRNQSAMHSVVILLEDPESYELKRDNYSLIKYSRMLAETEHKFGMYSFVYHILDDYTMYKDSEGNDYYHDAEERVEAVSFCKKSADLDHRDVMVLYAECLLYDHYAEKNEEEGIRYLLKSIEDEDEASDLGYLLYGELLFKGEFVTQDREKAAKYEKEAMYEYLKMMKSRIVASEFCGFFM